MVKYFVTQDDEAERLRQDLEARMRVLAHLEAPTVGSFSRRENGRTIHA